MAHLGVINLPELLEQILYFLAVDKFLYPALFVSRLWYRCGAPILWKHVELKKGERKDCTQLKKFMKIVQKRQKPVYSLYLWPKLSEIMAESKSPKPIFETLAKSQKSG